MCYAKPGPRCSGHVQRDIKAAEAAYYSNPTAENFEVLSAAQDALMRTPEGIKKLRAEGHHELAQVYETERATAIDEHKRWENAKAVASKFSTTRDSDLINAGERGGSVLRNVRAEEGVIVASVDAFHDPRETLNQYDADAFAEHGIDGLAAMHAEAVGSPEFDPAERTRDLRAAGLDGRTPVRFEVQDATPWQRHFRDRAEELGLAPEGASSAERIQRSNDAIDAIDLENYSRRGVTVNEVDVDEDGTIEVELWYEEPRIGVGTDDRAFWMEKVDFASFKDEYEAQEWASRYADDNARVARATAASQVNIEKALQEQAPGTPVKYEVRDETSYVWSMNTAYDLWVQDGRKR